MTPIDTSGSDAIPMDSSSPESNTTPVVLWIGGSQSECGACGRSADLSAKSHDQVLGYAPGPGCGAIWTHVEASYPDQELRESAARLRPDLILGLPEGMP